MSDLVKRLNQMAGEYGAMCGEGELADRAADRIELLEGIVRELYECGAVTNWLRVGDDLRARVKAAITTDSGDGGKHG